MDLRTLRPLDTATVLDSVKKTGKLLIVHEDNITGGVGSEIAALAADAAFDYLDAPITGSAARTCRQCLCPNPGDAYMPNTHKIAKPCVLWRLTEFKPQITYLFRSFIVKPEQRAVLPWLKS